MALPSKRLLRLGADTGIRFTNNLLYRFSSSTSLPPNGSSVADFNRISHLRVKPTGTRTFLVDTLALVRTLESQGIPSKEAEVITAAMTKVLNDTWDNCNQTFVLRNDMQKIEMLQDAKLSKYVSEVKSSQENHFSVLQRETEKLRGDVEKLRSELKYEIDKVSAGQRLDLNLERGRTRDELARQSAESTNLCNQLDREIHASRAQMEAAKYEVIKYCIGTLVSLTAVGLAVIRVLL